MDRMTIRGDHGVFMNEGWDFGIDPDDYDLVQKILERLAAYEDTGLSPKICAEYKKFEDEAVGNGVLFSRIIELMEADKVGRLVVIPEPSDNGLGDLLEPMKVGYALKSEIMKLNFRQEHDPRSVSAIDYTIIAALEKALKGGDDG